ncbi:hypothetical protein JG677_08070 [Campylobacter sp. TTU-622]|uniref:hypothetical protein n=1 Tax=Campylobacter sp. TTU-622 TaxID=2800583 RepID=UPI0019089D08|nr:hypothetical protein [Campylobacter sp. TTU-622]MBK1973998.1 hypothetical protein [Campylobacter sp. TTU-622]
MRIFKFKKFLVHEFFYNIYIFLSVCAFIKIFAYRINFVKISNISRVNFTITMNARGGPGIVLASVAYYYQIINVSFL